MSPIPRHDLMARGALKKKFLFYLRKKYSVATALKLAGISSSVAYKERKQDRAFALAWKKVTGEVLADKYGAARWRIPFLAELRSTG